MAKYVTDDGEPHATAVARDRKTAARNAFSKLLDYNECNNICIVTVHDCGLNPDHSHDIPSYILRLEYDTSPDSEIPDNADVGPRYDEIKVTAIPVHPNGESATFDDNPNETTILWKASVVDRIRYPQE